MSRFDEELDAPLHGECAAEIERLTQRVKELEAQTVAVPQGWAVNMLETLIDIWNDEKKHPEDRVYVYGALESQLAEISAMIAAEPERIQMTEMVDAAMVEMQNIHPPLRRSECERLIRAALDTAQINLSNKRNQT